MKGREDSQALHELLRWELADGVDYRRIGARLKTYLKFDLEACEAAEFGL
jgi:hypothetical protein